MSTMLDAKDWFTVQEVADRLNVTEGRVRQWLLRDEGEGARLKGTKFGKAWAISKEALAEFLLHERKPGNPNFAAS